MRTFKQFLTEANINFDTIDSSFDAKRAGRLQILKAADLPTTMYAEMEAYFVKATDGNMMKKYNAFVEAYPEEAKAINSIKPDGVGPGELVIYFVFNNIGIGGKNAPIDVYMDGKPYAEAKGGQKLGADAINNFKVTKDGDPAVTQLMDDLTDFNDKYEEITGEQLDGWRSAGSITINSLKDWRNIDLKSLAGETKGGSKKSIDLVLKKDGDLLRKGEDDPILNVNKDKSIAPVKKLIGGDSTVAVDDKVSTIDKIVKRWVDQAFEDYLGGKKFILVESASLRMRFFGTLSKDQLDLNYTNRNQPYAVVYLGTKKPKDEVEAEE